LLIVNNFGHFYPPAANQPDSCIPGTCNVAYHIVSIWISQDYFRASFSASIQTVQRLLAHRGLRMALKACKMSFGPISLPAPVSNPLLQTIAAKKGPNSLEQI